ncbi:MAG: O-antigen ligase family protein [Planctomycetaceae bacterium]|jgi:O-antigen ligase|nr:O-antigen ligase family protein [Planctomycetaceae bacterium]
MNAKSKHSRKSHFTPPHNPLTNGKDSLAHNNKNFTQINPNDSTQPITQMHNLSHYYNIILAGLVSLTVFLSGDLNERSGIVHLPTILWLIFAVVLTSLPILLKRPTPKLVFNRFDICIYLFFFYVFLSTIWNMFHGAAPRPTINMLSVWILGVTAWFVFRQLLHDTKITGVIFIILTVTIFAESSLAIYQQFIEIPQMKQLIQNDPVNTVKQADPTIEPGTPAWNMVYSRLITALPVGTYPLSNTLGGLLGCWLIFILGIYTLGQVNFDSNKIYVNKIVKFKNVHEIIFALFTLILLAAFIFAKSRSAFVAVGFGVILLMFLLVRRRIGKSSRRLLFIVTIIIAVGIAAISMTSGKDLISGAKKSFGFRLEYWTATFDMICDYPVFGCGSGNFKHTYTHYKLPISSEEISDPHNFIVEIASNCGIPAALLFIIGASAICFRIKNGKKNNAALVTAETGSGDVKNCQINSDNYSDNYSSAVAASSADSICPSISSDWLTLYFAGGLAGCYVAFVLSLYSESPLGLDAPLVATFVFILFCFVDMRRFERIPSAVIFVALIVLITHISASSGMSMTNTIILVWLFLSVLANRRSIIETAILQSRLRYAISVTFIILTLFVNFFGFRPVTNSNDVLYRLEFVSDIGDQVLLLETAAKADPYSAAIQERLARVATLCYLQEPNNKKWLETAEKAQAKAMKLAPRSGMIRYSCAEMRAEAGRRLKDVKLAESAIEIYREAIKYYPNSAAIHTAFAIILYQLNMKTEAKKQAKIALELDDKMIHTELKIKPDKKKALLKYSE